MIYRDKYNRSDIGDRNNNKKEKRGGRDGMREVSGSRMKIIYGDNRDENNNGGNVDDGGSGDMGGMDRVKMVNSVVDSDRRMVGR